MVDITSPLRRAAAIDPYTDAEQSLRDNAFTSPFSRSLRQAINTDVAGTYRQQALEAQVRGDAAAQRTAEYNRQSALRRMELPTVGPTTWDAASESGSYGDYVQNVLGSMAGSMVKPLVASSLGGLAGGPIGAAVGGFGGSYSAIRNAELEKYAGDEQLASMSPAEQLRVTRNSAALQAVPEAVMPAYLGAGGRLPGALSRMSTPLRVAGSVATEGATEGLQDYISQRVAQEQFPDRQIDWSSVRENAIAGLIGGGAMGVLGQHEGGTYRQEGEAAPIDLNPPSAPMEGAPPGTPLPLTPDDGSGGGGVSGLFDTLNERFGPGLREQAQRTKDYVSDTVDRMGEAAKTAQSPSDFLRQVFGSRSEDAAAADLRFDTEDPSVLNSTDPAAAVQQRDAQRQERAAAFAEELLNDPATPDAVKERISSLGGDFSNPEARTFVARALVSQRAGEKMVNAVSDLIDLSKDLGGKAVGVSTDLAAKARGMIDKGMSAAADRIVKKSLQDATPAEQAAFNKLVFDSLTDEAKASPAVRQRLPELANSMLAFAARTGDLTKADLKTLSRMQDGLAMFRDPEALATQLTEYAGLPRTEDSFLSRVKRVTNAQQDILQPNSFLYNSLSEDAKGSLSPPQLRQLARLVDTFTLSDQSKAQGDKVLAGLTAAFGSKEAAQSVLDYYQQQNRADLRFDPNEMLIEGGTTERDGAPAPTYHFADPKAMRPYRAFAGQMSSEVGTRRRLRESAIAGAALRRSSPGGARVRPVKMSQYVTDTGGNPETEVKRIAADLKDRIDQHKARKGEDRSQQINQLQGELALMRQAYKDGGAQAALDLYEVLQVSGQEQNDTIASDEDVAKMATLADVKDAKETRVTFQREDGSKFTLSAESMWKTLGDKEGSGKGENAQARAKRLFADAAASVLARPEVAKMVTPMEKILIDRKLDVRAKKKDNPEYRRMVSEALRAAEGSLKQLESTLDAVVDEYLEAADNEAKSEEYGTRREEIEGIIEKNIDQLSERLDAAREGKGSMAGNMPAQAVARQKLRMYRDAQSQIDAIKFDEDFDERDNDRPGIPGADDTPKDFGSEYRRLERQRADLQHAYDVAYDSGDTAKIAAAERALVAVQDNLKNTEAREAVERSYGSAGWMAREGRGAGIRYYEEDTGLGVGVEKRGKKAEASTEKKEAKAEAKKEAPKAEPKPKTISEAAVNALYDIAVNENYGRLDTPEKVLRYAAMARALMDQLAQIPEDARTDQQQELLFKLRDNFEQDGLVAFDWDMMFDGMKPTGEQRALLKDIVAKKSAMGAKKGRPGKIDTQKILDEIHRIRGDKVKVAFVKFSEIGGSGEFSMDKDKTERLIKIAVNASNPMGTAWHESLHDFFAMLDETPSHRSIKKDLLDAAEAPQVKKRLRELLAKHPEALKQIEESAEERVAYMYQFWAEGLLTLGPTGTSVFDRVRQLFHDLFGLISTEQRASDLLEALHEGKFAEPSTVAEVLADMSGDRLGNKMEKAAPELTAALGKVFQTAPDRLRAYQNDTLNKLADMFSSERGKAGFIQNRFQQQGVWENKLAGVLAGTTAQERRAALDNLQAMKTPSTKLEKDLAKFFGEMHGYMSEAGVKTLDSKTKKWVPLREVKGYFPRVFDRHEIMKDRAGFISLLQQHGSMDLKQANAVVDALTHGTGQLELAENEHALGFTPYAQAVQDRRFTFINPGNAADFAKYQVKDLADVTTSYVKQAVHRAEYSRMFGNDGEVITKMLGESGIKDRKELEDIGKVVQGLEGSLGSGMSTATKELMSGIMTLQNVVVLPLAIFSQMVDPVVLAARSGELKDAGTAYMTAVKRLVGKKVDGEELADMLGIISQDSVLEAMGAAYGTVHMSKRMRDINRVFFKYNGMQGWNNSMRIAATAAGERYLISNKDNDKALAELGLTSKDVKVDKNGRLNVSSPNVQQAMFRFVDQAVLRPSASNRPVWMSDPRFLLVAHLKQFTYAMHNVVLKRASRELADGNPKPWGILMLTLPAVLAADMAKFALTGTAPSTWGFKDYLVHAVERSGLLGLGDFGVQATRGVDMGKMPGEGLLGPTFENLMEILRWVGGDPRTGLGDVIDRTVPGSRFV